MNLLINVSLLLLLKLCFIGFLGLIVGYIVASGFCSFGDLRLLLLCLFSCVLSDLGE